MSGPGGRHFWSWKFTHAEGGIWTCACGARRRERAKMEYSIDGRHWTHERPDHAEMMRMRNTVAKNLGVEP